MFGSTSIFRFLGFGLFGEKFENEVQTLELRFLLCLVFVCSSRLFSTSSLWSEDNSKPGKTKLLFSVPFSFGLSRATVERATSAHVGDLMSEHPASVILFAEKLLRNYSCLSSDESGNHFPLSLCLSATKSKHQF